MPSPTKGPRLGGGPAHERLILANLATALFEHDSITTTEAKAKRLRPLAERLITFAKRGDLHARRRVMTVVRDKGVVHRLFVEIAPDMAARPGGYTRITKIAARKGDNAPMCVIELVREPLSPKQATVREAEAATKRAARTRKATDAPASGATAVEAADAPAAEATEVPVVPKDAPVAAEGMGVAAPLADGAALADDGEADDAAATDIVADDSVSATATDAVEQPVAVELPAGAVAPNADGSAPAGYTVKGNADSGLYHVEGSQWYDTTDAEFWFTDATAAEAAGFKPAGGAAKQHPAGFDIKGNRDSMLYHVPGSQWYDATEAEIWFESAEAAEKAGYQPAGGAEKQQVDDQA